MGEAFKHAESAHQRVGRLVRAFDDQNMKLAERFGRVDEAISRRSRHAGQMEGQIDALRDLVSEMNIRLRSIEDQYVTQPGFSDLVDRVRALEERSMSLVHAKSAGWEGILRRVTELEMALTNYGVPLIKSAGWRAEYTESTGYVAAKSNRYPQRGGVAQTTTNSEGYPEADFVVDSDLSEGMAIMGDLPREDKIPQAGEPWSRDEEAIDFGGPDRHMSPAHNVWKCQHRLCIAQQEKNAEAPHDFSYPIGTGVPGTAMNGPSSDVITVAEAERRIRRYMTTHFSTGTIERVVRAVRGFDPAD